MKLANAVFVLSLVLLAGAIMISWQFGLAAAAITAVVRDAR